MIELARILNLIADEAFKADAQVEATQQKLKEAKANHGDVCKAQLDSLEALTKATTLMKIYNLIDKTFRGNSNYEKDCINN